MGKGMTRREALGKTAATAGLLGAASMLGGGLRAEDQPPGLKGRINQSACRWCYAKVPLDALCAAGKDMGLKSIDLVEVSNFPVLQKHGLICAMVTGVPGMITDGFNRPENHDRLAAWFGETIPKVADAGYPNMICFSGNRKGMDDRTGMENCATGLKRVAPVAEKYKVTVCMELLNSKINHPDYMCDHTAWGVELRQKVGSENFKLLYDIYHMQIMEGDVIHTIRENHPHFAHYHTGGVPGRHEIDDTQELNYPAIMRAILDTGFQGYVAQEFVPARPDVLASLRQGVQICDV
jgi:hydroxypyruvate isomerase